MRTANALRAALLTLTLAVTAAASAVPAHYTVTMTERYAGAGSERGTLDLRIPADGIISGSYHTFDGVGPYPVSGGRRGDLVWLDYRNVRVIATLGPKSIDGRAFREGSTEEYGFHAVLTP